MGRIFRHILAGAGSTLQLMPPPRRVSIARDLRDLTDRDALASDWQRVGESLRVAMDKVSATLSSDERARLESARSGHGDRKSATERYQHTLFDDT